MKASSESTCYQFDFFLFCFICSEATNCTKSSKLLCCPTQNAPHPAHALCLSLIHFYYISWPNRVIDLLFRYFFFFLNISKSNKYSNVVFVHVSMLFLAGCMWWEQQPNTSPVVCCGKWHMLTQVVCQKINSGDLVMCIGDTIYIYIYRCLKWTRHRHGIDQP